MLCKVTPRTDTCNQQFIWRTEVWWRNKAIVMWHLCAIWWPSVWMI